MLKWAVTSPRPSYLQSMENVAPIGGAGASAQKVPRSRRTINAFEFKPNQASDQTCCSLAERRRLRRKSSDMHLLRRKSVIWEDKENQLTSTPLPAALRCPIESPLRKLDSLKDLSNIVPENLVGASPKPLIAGPTLDSPVTPLHAAGGMPRNYASTLPTFDVEYSPCGLVPGPILALRGLGVPDSYFEKPRYLTHEYKELTADSVKKPKRTLQQTETKNLKSELISKCLSSHLDESSLCSSKIGDMTLERMIDAILESARKERKLPKSSKAQFARPRAQVMSPTYTRADDPASDLCEFWNTETVTEPPVALPKDQEPSIRSRSNCNVRKSTFREREVRSPLHDTRRAKLFQLRRQRAVRRKRKFNKITASVKSSAQKLIASVSSKALGGNEEAVAVVNNNDNNNDESCRDPANREFQNVNNISPDSGHNSSSDFEDECTLEAVSPFVAIAGTQSVDDSKLSLTLGVGVLDATKRRLSFSSSNNSKLI